jgi:hypothetical protein
MPRLLVTMMWLGLLAGCGRHEDLATPAAAHSQDAKAAPQTVPAQPPRYVELRRVPDGGIQPQALRHEGTLHLIYFKGDPRRGDIFYVASRDDGQTFSKPLRVNSEPGSAVAMGNIRGAQLAVSDSGRAHVAWMGSQAAKPAAPGGATPMLYSRLNDAKDAFEPQRNLIAEAVGLDGGGSLAAYGQNVYVFWHAPTPGTEGEHHRRVWLRASADDGATFGKERPISPPETGVCGCCGLRGFVAHPGQPGVLYRSARDGVHRDMYLVRFDPRDSEFRPFKLQPWETATCPMTTAAFVDVHNQSLIAWETEGQIWLTTLARGGGQPGAKAVGEPTTAPGKAKNRKHPALAVNGRNILLAWTEGMGWNKGGKLAWQVYDFDLKAINEPRFAASGQADGVPVWSLISAVSLGNERFAIFY